MYKAKRRKAFYLTEYRFFVDAIDGKRGEDGYLPSEAYVGGQHLPEEIIPETTVADVISSPPPQPPAKSNEDVYSWLANEGQYATFAGVAAWMRSFNVSVAQMAEVSGYTQTQIQDAIDGKRDAHGYLPSEAYVGGQHLRTDGSHANGLDNVPFDGYVAQLHKGEMVLPAGQSDYLRNGETGKQFKALADEIAELRKDNKTLLAQISTNTRDNARTAKSMSRGTPVYMMVTNNESN